MSAKRMSSPAQPHGVLDDPSKNLGLLFGTLVALSLYGLGESVVMFRTARPASLVEIIIFALLAVDGIILMFAIRRRREPNLGWFGLLGVWVLGLIPYFGWVVIYAAGKGLASLLERRWRYPWLIAMLVWSAVVFVCLYAYVLASHAVQPYVPPG